MKYLIKKTIVSFLAIVLAASTATGTLVFGAETETSLESVDSIISVSEEINNDTDFMATAAANEQSFSGSGEGTESNPYVISNAQQLNEIRNDLSAYYVLNNDIDITSYKNWKPIGLSQDNYFNGVLDGKGNKIVGLTYDYDLSQDEEYIGLFYGLGNKAELKNIQMDDVNIDLHLCDTNRTFAIGTLAVFGGIIENCNTSGKIAITTKSEKAAFLPLISGIGNTDAVNCINNIDIFVNAQIDHAVVGGISAEGGKIENCINYGDIDITSISSSAEVSCGGISGNSNKINGCVNYGNVNATTTDFVKAGGISGEAGYEDSIRYCINYGDITGGITASSSFGTYPNVCVGGIMGAGQDTEILSSCNKGNISGYINNASSSLISMSTGGIVGYLFTHYYSSNIEDCVNAGNIKQNIEKNQPKGSAGIINGNNLNYTKNYYLKSTSILNTDDRISCFDNSAYAIDEDKLNIALVCIENQLGLPTWNSGEYVDATSISLDKTEVEIGVGGTIFLEAILTPYEISTDSIIWSSSNNDVAFVAGGKVTANGIGKAVITAMTANGLKATCTVRVKKNIIQGQINHQLSGYGGSSSGTSNEEEVRYAFQDFASAIDAYMDTFNEAVKTEANTAEEVASLREKDQKKSQPALTGVCDDDGALNAAYAGLAGFYDKFYDECPSLQKIDLSKSITEIESQIIKEIIKSFKTYNFSISSGNFNVKVHAYSQFSAFSGSITVTRKNRNMGKTNSYTFILSSDLNTNVNTMAQYYQVLSDTAEQVVKDGLKAYLKDVAKLTYITQITREKFESYIRDIVDYMKEKGYGNLLKYAVSLYDGYNIAKRISSLTNQKSLAGALADAESLYDQIKNLDFSDGSIKNKTVATALKKVKEKKENLEDILYNYIYHPEEDLNSSVNWFEKVWNSWFNGGKKATVQCPVTLTVFDENGNQIGYAEDGYCEFDNNIYMEVSGDVKTVYIPQDLNVSISLTGTDDGIMNYTLEEYENGEPTGRKNYYNISLTNGGRYTQTIPSGAMQTSTEAFPLNTDDGKQIIADEYISVNDSAVCDIDCDVNDGGTVCGIGKYAKGDAVTLVAYPADGYQFDGWYDGDLLVEVSSTYRMTALDDVIVKAVFKPILKKQTISCKKTIEKYVGDKAFGLNAAVDGDGKLYYYSEDENIATVSPDGMVTVKKEGTVKIFVAASGTDSYADTVEIVTIKCLPKAVSSYTVTYNANGGKNAPASQKKKKGKTLTLSKKKPTRTGYTFLGWATSKKASKAAYKPGAKYKKDKKLTLYAVWKAHSYKVAFNANGGKGKMSAVSRTYGKAAKLPANKFKRTGYQFAGWNTKKNGKGKSYGDKASVKNLTSASGKKVILYARWEKAIKTVKVTYNANGGKVSAKSKSVSVGKTYGTLKKPTRKGYTFAGWYMKKTGGSRVKASTKVTTRKNHTLYAHWKKTKYTITYVLSGGKNHAKNPGSYDITSATITLKAPARTGYKFKGWYADSAFKKKITKISKGSTGNKKLYARWEKIQPASTATPTPVPSETVTPTPAPTLSVAPTPTPTETVIPTPTDTPSPAPTQKPDSNSPDEQKEEISISSADQLRAIADNLSGNYKLTANIDLANVEWTPIGTDKNTAFTGTLNGNGFSVSNLKVTDVSLIYGGLFGYCRGTVQNLTVSGSIEVTGRNGSDHRYVGGIAGFADGAVIEQCTNQVMIDASNENETTGTYSYCGGIAGCIDNRTAISGCKNESDISAAAPKGTRADAAAGGIVGMGLNGCSIRSCTNTGKISSDAATNSTQYWVAAYSGGIIGSAGSSIVDDCKNYGEIKANAYASQKTQYDSMSIAAGIAGACYDSGKNISGTNYADTIQATGNENIPIQLYHDIAAFMID